MRQRWRPSAERLWTLRQEPEPAARRGLRDDGSGSLRLWRPARPSGSLRREMLRCRQQTRPEPGRLVAAATTGSVCAAGAIAGLTAGLDSRTCGWARPRLGHRAGQEAVAQRGFEIGNEFVQNAGLAARVRARALAQGASHWNWRGLCRTNANRPGSGSACDGASATTGISSTAGGSGSTTTGSSTSTGTSSSTSTVQIGTTDSSDRAELRQPSLDSTSTVGMSSAVVLRPRRARSLFRCWWQLRLRRGAQQSWPDRRSESGAWPGPPWPARACYERDRNESLRRSRRLAGLDGASVAAALATSTSAGSAAGASVSTVRESSHSDERSISAVRSSSFG